MPSSSHLLSSLSSFISIVFAVTFFALLLATATSSSSFLFVAAYVNVTPPSPTWLGDASTFNFAPVEALPTGPVPVASAVLFCKTEADVAAALAQIITDSGCLSPGINCSRASTQPNAKSPPLIQVRSGRHSYLAASSVTRGAVVVDVSNMTSVGEPFQAECPSSSSSSFSSASEPCTLINVSSGLRLFHLYAKLASHGLMFAAGTCPSVGLSGYVGGGGALSLFARQYGIASQNLVAATLLHIDEKFSVKKSFAKRSWWSPSSSKSKTSKKSTKETEEDANQLLWAIAGAGNNNFGVVTSYTLRVYPAPKTAAWVRIHAPKPAMCPQMLRVYEDFLEKHSGGGGDGSLDDDDPLCNISVTLDLYRNDCSIILNTGTDAVSATALEQISHEHFEKKIPGSYRQASTGPLPWLQALSNISDCADVESCLIRAARPPNPSAPQRWAAMSIFTTQKVSGNEILMRRIFDAIRSGGDDMSGRKSSSSSFDNENKKVGKQWTRKELIERFKSVEGAKHKREMLMKEEHDEKFENKNNGKTTRSSVFDSQNIITEHKNCSIFALVLADSMGCKIRKFAAAAASQTNKTNNTKNNFFFSTSFPSTDALAHFQILAYALDSGSAHCRHAIEDWGFNVFRTFKHASGDDTWGKVYVNYPSEFLAKPNTQYFGDNERVLKQMASELDPNAVFGSEQGLQFR